MPHDEPAIEADNGPGGRTTETRVLVATRACGAAGAAIAHSLRVQLGAQRTHFGTRSPFATIRTSRR